MSSEIENESNKPQGPVGSRDQSRIKALIDQYNATYTKVLEASREHGFHTLRALTKMKESEAAAAQEEDKAEGQRILLEYSNQEQEFWRRRQACWIEMMVASKDLADIRSRLWKLGGSQLLGNIDRDSVNEKEARALADQASKREGLFTWIVQNGNFKRVPVDGSNLRIPEVARKRQAKVKGVDVPTEVTGDSKVLSDWNHASDIPSAERMDQLRTAKERVAKKVEIVSASNHYIIRSMRSQPDVVPVLPLDISSCLVDSSLNGPSRFANSNLIPGPYVVLAQAVKETDAGFEPVKMEKACYYQSRAEAKEEVSAIRLDLVPASAPEAILARQGRLSKMSASDIDDMDDTTAVATAVGSGPVCLGLHMCALENASNRPKTAKESTMLSVIVDEVMGTVGRLVPHQMNSNDGDLREWFGKATGALSIYAPSAGGKTQFTKCLDRMFKQDGSGSRRMGIVNIREPHGPCFPLDDRSMEEVLRLMVDEGCDVVAMDSLKDATLWGGNTGSGGISNAIYTGLMDIHLSSRLDGMLSLVVFNSLSAKQEVIDGFMAALRGNSQGFVFIENADAASQQITGYLVAYGISNRSPVSFTLDTKNNVFTSVRKAEIKGDISTNSSLGAGFSKLLAPLLSGETMNFDDDLPENQEDAFVRIFNN